MRNAHRRNTARHPLSTIRELAAWLQIHPVALYRAAKAGKIPAIKAGGRWRFSRDAIECWILDRMNAQTALIEEPGPWLLDFSRPSFADALRNTLGRYGDHSNHFPPRSSSMPANSQPRTRLAAAPDSRTGPEQQLSPSFKFTGSIPGRPLQTTRPPWRSTRHIAAGNGNWRYPRSAKPLAVKSDLQLGPIPGPAYAPQVLIAMRPPARR